MKNLKLINFQHEFDIEKADSFTHDYDGNAYFASSETLYCLQTGSNELFICAELESEVNKDSFVVGIEVILDVDKVFIASSSGEIYTYDIYTKEITTVGIVDSGIENFAWNPDQEVLILLTGANTLILMTKDFDPIREKSLCPIEFGESRPITVGWGSKETQFHGSEGKDAAKIKQIEPKPALPYDDGRPRVSWKADGEYFVTSSIHSAQGFRQLRIWSRGAVLQFTAEAKDGLEESLCWRSRSNLIACSQQHVNKHKIIFFEKNGLQHGEFALPFKPNTHKVVSLLWNPDSTVLLIIAEPLDEPSCFKIMLWICGNYHWYLKQTFSLPKTESGKSVVAKWNERNPYELFFLNQTTNEFYSAKWSWTLSSNFGICDNDDTLVASIDNDNLLITPFNKMVVPPPMCSYSYTFPSAVQDVCFAPDSPKFCCYLGNFNLAFFEKRSVEDIKPSDDCKVKLVAAGGNGFISKVLPYAFNRLVKLNLENVEALEYGLCHWTWAAGNTLLCICSIKQNSFTKYALISVTLPTTLDEPLTLLSGSLSAYLECSVVGMCSDATGKLVAVQLSNGKILKFTFGESSDASPPIGLWLCKNGSPLIVSQHCITMSIIHINGKECFLGLTERFSLLCDNSAIVKNCTSYYIHDEYLLVTTTDHVLKCFLINYDLSGTTSPHSDSDIPFQRIEKGAKIITAPPNSTKVILQMPRGNLETIHPRPLVLSCVCKHLDKLQYDKAFELCKIHRIDLNILFDHNPKEFLENIELFVNQLNSASNINLFLASLKDEDICVTLYALAYKGKIRQNGAIIGKSKIDVICDAMREILESLNDDRFFLSLIATYAKKMDPELHTALIRLKHLKDSGSKNSHSLVDSALNFLMYLVDVNDLIDVALGTYDLEITIMVAQKSQKDPKEFLPFYNELQQMEENYRKYKIDVHLQRYKLALQHISKCEERFHECLDLIKTQRLYTDALYLFPASSDNYKVVWKEYGSYLMEKRYYDEAALAFVRGEEHEKALLAYKESLNWQCMLCLANHLSYSDDKITTLCLETADKLKSNQKYLDASYLLEQYVKDIEESIVTLVEGCEWNTALLLMSKYKRNDIAETHLKPALTEHYNYLHSHIEQLAVDFSSHTERLKVVRAQKSKEAELPDIVKHHDEELFSETDSVTDGASSVTASKQLSGSIMTRKSSKSRRKQKLKKYRLKEGSADEDLAHIAALSEIVVKIDCLKDNFLNTLKTLVQFGFDSHAKSLQQQLSNLVSVVELNMPDIWRPLDNNRPNSDMKFGPDSTANSIATLLQSQAGNVNSLNTDPELIQPPWRKIDFTLQMFK